MHSWVWAGAIAGNVRGRHHGHHRSRTNLTTKDQPFHVSIVVDVPGEELVVKRDPKDFSALKDHQDLNIALRDAFATMQRRLKEYVAKRWRSTRHHSPAPI